MSQKPWSELRVMADMKVAQQGGQDTVRDRRLSFVELQDLRCALA